MKTGLFANNVSFNGIKGHYQDINGKKVEFSLPGDNAGIVLGSLSETRKSVKLYEDLTKDEHLSADTRYIDSYNNVVLEQVDGSSRVDVANFTDDESITISSLVDQASVELANAKANIGTLGENARLKVCEFAKAIVESMKGIVDLKSPRMQSVISISSKQPQNLKIGILSQEQTDDCELRTANHRLSKDHGDPLILSSDYLFKNRGSCDSSDISRARITGRKLIIEN